uniref:Transmembrane 4 L six family member 4 n=1 Tax=Echeneis naucrates TaxID=173247 RepID=A0A665VC02_ECHNA
MCSGSFAKCLGATLVPLSVLCVLCNILLFFPSGKSIESKHITNEVWYFGGILGSGVLNNDCCGCCGNDNCGRRFMLGSMLFAAVGVLGSGYSVIVSAVAISSGPMCMTFRNATLTVWNTPFNKGNYLSKTSMWSACKEPVDVVSWHLTLFSILLVAGLIQVAICAVQVVNGLLGALCGDCLLITENKSVYLYTAIQVKL